MEIIRVLEEDYDDSIELSMYAFQYKISKEDIPLRKEKMKHHEIFGIRENDILAAKLHLLPFHIMLFGKEWKMGGVAGVATYPEFRRSGYVKELILHSLKQMKENGQIVSMLHPFDISFYRKFGWEIFCENRKVTIQNQDLKFITGSKGRIKRITKDSDTTDVKNIYSAYCSRYSGMLVRDKVWWENSIFGESKIAVYYNERNEPAGYMLYSIEKRKLEVEEIIALDQGARATLWNFICQHDSMVDTIEISLPPQEHFPYFIDQPKLKTEITPYFMARIVDAEQCLRMVDFRDSDRTVFLHLEDQQAEWNTASFLIGKGEVRKFEGKEGTSCVHPPRKGIRGSINSLTAILFGYKRPLDLFDMGMLDGPLEDIITFEKMMPISKPFFYDYF